MPYFPALGMLHGSHSDEKGPSQTESDLFGESHDCERRTTVLSNGDITNSSVYKSVILCRFLWWHGQKTKQKETRKSTSASVPTNHGTVFLSFFFRGGFLAFSASPIGLESFETAENKAAIVSQRHVITREMIMFIGKKVPGNSLI